MIESTCHEWTLNNRIGKEAVKYDEKYLVCKWFGNRLGCHIKINKIKQNCGCCKRNDSKPINHGPSR